MAIHRSSLQRFFLYLLFVFPTFAGGDFAIAAGRNQDFSKENFAVAVGAEYISQVDRRGIITYGSYQAFPIFSVDLFHPDLQLVGSSLNYRWRTDQRDLTLRARLDIDSTNDHPLYETAEKRTDRIRRTKTSEVEGFLEWRVLELLELSANISQDVGAHGGTHGEIRARLILGDFLERAGRGAMIQPALFGSIGGATLKHNEYLYGAGAVGGLSHFGVGFSISSPAAIDTFYPVLKITRFGILGENNRSAAFVRSDEKDSWQVLALAAFRIW